MRPVVADIGKSVNPSSKAISLIDFITDIAYKSNVEATGNRPRGWMEMNKLIAKARTATTDQLFEMAMLLNDATAKEAVMARAAVTVALEERVAPDEFDAFFAALDAA